jgi:anion-transporting  ArsA/GET3 family ATPase
VERYLDQIVGLDLLRDIGEFFQAFGPLYEGFRERASEVKALLSAPQTLFVLVAGPGEERNSDTLFFARRLREAGYRLGPVVVNRVHPWSPDEVEAAEGGRGSGREGMDLMAWLARRDREGLAALRQLLGPEQPLAALPLLDHEPTDVAGLGELAGLLQTTLDGG